MVEELPPTLGLRGLLPSVQLLRYEERLHSGEKKFLFWGGNKVMLRDEFLSLPAIYLAQVLCGYYNFISQ